MVKALVRKSIKSDCGKLSPILRLADRREVIAHSGQSAKDGLETALNASDECWSVDYDDKPIAMFGYLVDSGGSANVWMLGSDKIKDIRWQFLRESKRWLNNIAKDFDRVWAVADVRNKKHTDWYTWLGFSIMATIHAGPFGLPFYYIEYTKGDK